MSDTHTPQAPRVCAVTGQESTGKFYRLTTTDGPEELVSPDALFGALEMVRSLTELVDRLSSRLAVLEEGDGCVKAPGEDQEHGQEPLPDPEPGPVEAAARKAAAPVKKAAARKRAARVPAQKRGEVE